jgi:nucleotide-binding universal stress UspA family protein
MADSCNSRWIDPAVILVATDLSDLNRLMPVAIDQAGQTSARLILFHVLAGPATRTIEVTGVHYYDPCNALETAERELRPWCEMARSHGIDCNSIVREGNASYEIAAATRQFNADRIILGTRSRSRLGKMLLGSVAEQVLRSVTIPVMTVGPEAHLPVQSGDEEHVVLHATTLRETSRPSAALACRVAAQLSAKLVLLHVLPPFEEMAHEGPISDFEAAATRELDALAAEAGEGCTLETESMVLHGNPFIEILAEAAARKASLIVLSATDRSAFENLTRDRTVYRVLAHARCPVLTLRETEPSSEAEAEHVETAHC